MVGVTAEGAHLPGARHQPLQLHIPRSEYDDLYRPAGPYAMVGGTRALDSTGSGAAGRVSSMDRSGSIFRNTFDVCERFVQLTSQLRSSRTVPGSLPVARPRTIARTPSVSPGGTTTMTFAPSLDWRTSCSRSDDWDRLRAAGCWRVGRSPLPRQRIPATPEPHHGLRQLDPSLDPPARAQGHARSLVALSASARAR